METLNLPKKLQQTIAGANLRLYSSPSKEIHIFGAEDNI